MYQENFPATVRVHFSTTTPVEPATRSIRHRSHLLRKSLKILNTAANYTVAREAHRVANIRWAAIYSGASGNYFPDTYDGGNHDPLAPVVTVGCTNDAAIKSTERDTLRHKKTPTEGKNLAQIQDHYHTINIGEPIMSRRYDSYVRQKGSISE